MEAGWQTGQSWAEARNEALAILRSGGHRGDRQRSWGKVFTEDGAMNTTEEPG